MLSAVDVVLSYGYRTVLRGVTVELRPGEGVGLSGPNGAGKSTLLRVLALLLRPQAGEVRLDGQRVSTESVAVRRKIGYLGHQPGVYDGLSARENLAFAAALYARQVDVDAWLRRAGLAFASDERVETFSRGMRQRLALARVLMTEPTYLLLDEPFSALDPQGAVWLQDELLQRVRAGLSHLVVGHDQTRIAAVVQRSLRLTRGRLVQEDA
jgi:heme exporter protein A